jgi:hypothetical protein
VSAAGVLRLDSVPMRSAPEAGARAPVRWLAEAEADFAEQQSFNVIFVNNGSTDIRVERALSTFESLGLCKVVSSRVNLGFGGGVKHGLEECSSEIVGWYPLNLKVDFKDVTRIAKGLKSGGPFLVKAWRSQRTLVDSMKSLAVGIVHSIVSFVNLLDSGGTPTFTNMRARILAAELPSGYEFELAVLLIARSENWEINRPKVRYGKRKFGQSHWQTSIKNEFHLLQKQLRYLRRPK